MKVLFVYSLDSVRTSRKPLRSWSCMQHGISYISSLLRIHGHQTSLVVLGSNQYRRSVQLLKASMDEFNPGLVCCTAVYSQYHFIEEMARFTKMHRPGTYVIAGGVHATLQPEEVVAGPFDAVCIGEGEFPVLELCHQLASRQTPQGIANLWIKSSDGSVEKNPPRALIPDLDVLPFPDHEMWRPWIEDRDGDEMTVFGGRGCPYDCTYCSNHALRKVAAGNYVRTRTPEDILREVVFLYENYPCRKIYLEIETLDCNKQWTMQLCHNLAEFNASIPDPLSYGSNYRINPHTIDENLFAALEKANFRELNIGLESGSERVRREVLKRHYTNEDVLTVVALARRHGMRVFIYNMIGLPGESLHDHKETVRLNRQCQPDGHHTGIFFPYPGTELHATCVQSGLITGSSYVRMERRQPVMDLPTFSRSQIRRAYVWFNYHVYRGYRPLWNLLIHAAQVKIDSNPMARFLFQKAAHALAAVCRAPKKRHT